MATSKPSPTGAHRLFFALWPDDSVRDGLAGAAASVPALQAGRAIDPGQYHLTLRYLGGWAQFPDAIAERARVAGAAVRARAFHLVIDRAGGFRDSKVGWLAPDGNSGLDALWSALGHSLDDAEVPHRVHEQFSPHVTVRRAIEVVATSSIEPVSWPVEGFVLVHSHGGAYTVLDRWALENA